MCGMSATKPWHGINRAAYDWFPAIDYDKCTGCGLCLLSCGNSVFTWSMNNNLPTVQNPGGCVLGCTTCGKVCPEDAISFPDDPKEFLAKVIKDNKIFPTVRKELQARLDKFPDHRISEGAKVVSE